MMKQSKIAVGLCLTLALALGFGPQPTRAADGDHEEPIRLRATATVGPIGTVAGSLTGAALAINGRAVTGEQAVWDGDLLQACADTAVSVRLDAIGQVTLARGATVRLATARNEGSRTLVASLVNGSMAVRLRDDARAYVRACGAAFTASAGADFRIGIREGRAVVDARAGTVAAETPAPQRKVNIRPVGHGDKLYVTKGKLVNIRLRITDGDERPVIETPVAFSLAPLTDDRKILGTIGLGATAGTAVTAVTDREGFVIVPFTAGQKKGETTVTAVVEETGTKWDGEIEIEGTNNARNAWIAAGVAAAIGGAVAIYLLTTENDPITTLPPETRP
ncbi:MAG TPA: hypothetical protein VNO70_27435 [Blastocatellia bacterium]|nr:hypothetical protein [Blastocatellia bacterium]